MMVVNPEDYVVGRLNRFTGRDDDKNDAGRSSLLIGQSSEHVTKWHKAVRSLLEDSFVALNQQVLSGRLGGFGVSSEGLAELDGPGVLHPSVISGAAANAAQRAGMTGLGGLRCIALPGNPVERRTWRGIGQWAANRNLGTLLTRPFTARDASGAPVPLDDIPPALLSVGAATSNSQAEAAVEASYEAVLGHAREWFRVPGESDEEWTSTYTADEREGFAESSAFVLELLEQMHSQRDIYTSPLSWEKDLTTKILPLLSEKVERIDDTSDGIISLFLQQYSSRVRWRCAAQTKRVLSSAISDGGLGYGAGLEQEVPWPGVTLDAETGSVRAFTQQWCRAVVESGEAQGVVLHAASADEAVGLALELMSRD